MIEPVHTLSEVLHIYHMRLAPTTGAVQAALQLTASQREDLLHLRRAYFGKVGQLARRRQAILEHMADSELDLPSNSSRHRQLEELAEQLRHCGMEQYRTHIQLHAIMYEGVSPLCSAELHRHHLLQ